MCNAQGSRERGLPPEIKENTLIISEWNTKEILMKLLVAYLNVFSLNLQGT